MSRGERLSVLLGQRNRRADGVSNLPAVQLIGFDQGRNDLDQLILVLVRYFEVIDEDAENSVLMGRVKIWQM